MTLGGAPQTERSVRKALPHTRTCRLAQVVLVLVLVFILVLAAAGAFPSPCGCGGHGLWGKSQQPAGLAGGRARPALSCCGSRSWGVCAAGGAKRNGSKKCSCYNDLLFSAVGSRVQLRTVTSFRYRDTDGQRRIWEAVTAQQIRFRTDQLFITSL